MKKKKIRVAVYGSLMKGLHNHTFLQDTEYLGSFYSLPEYNLYSLGTYPGLTLNGNTSVRFEVYNVTPDVLKKLDILEGVEYEYYIKQTINTPYGASCVYVYNCNDTYSLSNISSGDWNEYMKLKPELIKTN